MASTMSDKPLRILHCMRSPVGGLFRHVRDLARAQAERGHHVGILCDARTGGAAEAQSLAELNKVATLGVHRIEMGQQLGLGDYPAYRAAIRIAQDGIADVLHGHGGKGGAYARLAARNLRSKGQKVATFYTPHGGSLHYQPGTAGGMLYLGLERVLAPLTDGLIFESAYSARVYVEKVLAPRCATQVIPNGLLPSEFNQHVPAPDAYDFLYVGELRQLKGVDVLLAALQQIRREQPVRALIVGAGPDGEKLIAQAQALGLGDAATFAGAMPAQLAFPQGRCLIVPSRAESFPYIVLEAAAARLPLIATNAGGIPEIRGNVPMPLIEADNSDLLAAEMRAFLADEPAAIARAAELQAAVKARFTVALMTDAIVTFYRERLARAIVVNNC
jgi:glycosyltransferase involved in cell wall biosynthesis